MKRILVPTNFTKISRIGLEAALRVAKKHNAELYLVHFFQASGDSFSVSGDTSIHQGVSESDLFKAELIRASNKRMNRIVDEYASEGVRIIPLLNENGFRAGIEHICERYEIDMIVMGSSAERTFVEKFKGNHAERAVEYGHCPVLIVKENLPEKKFQRIMLTYDLKNHDKEVIHKAKEFADSFGMEIYLIHIYDDPAKSEKEMEARLKSFADEHELTNCRIVSYYHKDTAKGIALAAKELQIDTIVLLSNHHNYLSRFFLSTTTEEVLEDANQYIMAVPNVIHE
ncbi:universal stress protein [Marinigracilibium pacificum]|uniref:Universal stress protein n=1 Tax=Marinigracilibium pacificum TaxID=2729599 RepID=A0A848J0H9_9BACT|nr:universal stress protein [Marinigracilibium pacificum]NMM47984.1 universal stress protein [Marinigracilibium pacificum]